MDKEEEEEDISKRLCGEFWSSARNTKSPHAGEHESRELGQNTSLYMGGDTFSNLNHAFKRPPVVTTNLLMNLSCSSFQTASSVHDVDEFMDLAALNLMFTSVERRTARPGLWWFMGRMVKGRPGLRFDDSWTTSRGQGLQPVLASEKPPPDEANILYSTPVLTSSPSMSTIVPEEEEEEEDDSTVAAA